MKNTLTQEQVEKLKKCKTIEEAKEVAKIENLELSDDDLQSIGGGWFNYRPY